MPMSEDESPAGVVVPDEMEQAQTSCRKKTKAGSGLTQGMFTARCSCCQLQVGFSMMREHEGPSIIGVPRS